MRKILILIISSFLIFQLVSAGNVNIEKEDGWPVLVVDTGVPAKTTLHVTNLGEGDNFEMYTLIGITLAPRGKFFLETGRKSNLPIEIYLTEQIMQNTRGYFAFEYELNSPKNGITKDKLQLKIVELKDVLEIESIKIKPGDQEATITIKNKEKTTLDKIKIKGKSSFFDGEETFTIGPYEELSLKLPIAQDKIKKLTAGNYEGTFSFELKNAKATIKSDVMYLEKSGLAVSNSVEGAIVRTKTIKKTNEGNVNAVAEINDRRSIFTRLFTTQYPLASSVVKDGFYTSYSWSKEIAPGESFEIKITTNYTIPLIIALLIIIIVLAVKISISRTATVSKTVSFVKTKGGEFALKVTLRVNTRKHIDNVQIVDRVPGSMKLFAPSLKQGAFDSSTNRITLKLAQLNQGEERAISYIVYSKMNIVGKFELPSALVVYELNGKTQEVSSNVAYFMGETMNREE
jgi:hypothetical protein